MLFDPARHEPLQAAAWDPTRVRASIRTIAADLERSRTPAGLWPVHPLDDEGDEPAGGWKGLYLGAAGVLWSLWFLQRQGVIEAGLNLRAAIESTHAAWQTAPDEGKPQPSYFLGEAGVLLVRRLITGESALDARLEDVVRAHQQSPANELLYGAPGTMLAALHLWRATGDERWRRLYLENVDSLWTRWTMDADTGLHVWTQHFAGAPSRYLGAAHGMAGNAFPLLAGAALLAEPRREALYDRLAAAFHATAQREPFLSVAGPTGQPELRQTVNWPPELRSTSAAQKHLLQWCHGAPGIVTSLSAFPRGRSTELEALLVGAGETIWQAGPLAKGPGLCHGTSGNGAAFLSLHRRTGEQRWLDRARAFAMHAIGQQERVRREHGRPRATLWTGDAGVAIHLWQCLEGIEGMPLLELV